MKNNNMPNNMLLLVYYLLEISQDYRQAPTTTHAMLFMLF
jgi:hypothetical protein